jgi:hypothetical protein
MGNSLVLTEKLLDLSLAEPLLGLGFKRVRRLIFRKDALGVKQLLRFPTQLQDDKTLFNVNGAIRFEKIEELLGNTDPLSPTLMMPIHLLRPRKEHIEWQFIPESSNRLVAQVLGDCRQYLLPFLERMSVMEALKSQLLYEFEHYANTAARRTRLSSEAERVQFDLALQNDGRLRLVLSPEQRVEKLAAIYVLEGKKDSAENLIDSELSKLKGVKQLPPQIAQRLRWERLKEALLGAERRQDQH